MRRAQLEPLTTWSGDGSATNAETPAVHEVNGVGMRNVEAKSESENTTAHNERIGAQRKLQQPAPPFGLMSPPCDGHK